MNKKIIILLIATALGIGAGALALWAMSGDEWEDVYIRYYRYQLNEWGTSRYRLRAEMSRGEMAEALLERLFRLPELFSGSLTLDREMYVDSGIDGGTALVTLDYGFGELTLMEQSIGLVALVYTLTELDFIEDVKVFVGDDDLGRFDRGNLLISSEDLPDNVIERLYRLYFADAAQTELVVVERQITIQPGTPLETQLLEELIAGATTGDYRRLIPTDVWLRGNTRIDRGICYVDFNLDFLARMDSEELIALTVDSIVNTILNNTGVTQVQLLFGGDTTLAAIESIELAQPISRNE